jgi:hypothetical protein
MTLGIFSGHYTVVCGRGPRGEVTEETDFRQFHYVGDHSNPADEKGWGPAKDRSFDFAEKRRKEGWRCRVYHSVNHIVQEDK